MSADPSIREGMTRNQRWHHYVMTDVLKRLDYELHQAYSSSEAIPYDWEEIATRPDAPFKRQMTLRVDNDVLKFFKTTGRGYQTRMNDVLRAYMHARLCSVVVNGARFDKYVDDGEVMYDREDPLDRIEARMDHDEGLAELRRRREAVREKRRAEE